MAGLEEEYRPAAVARAARAIWATRGLPADDGVVGRSAAPLVRQFEGAYTGGDPVTLVAVRAVVADADARYLALSGRRALGTLRRETEAADDPIGPVLSELSVWTGGERRVPFDTTERRDGVAAILGRMAAQGLVVTRDASLRVCSYCAAPRSPERIIYQEEEGDTFLVRFPVVDGGRRVQALAWVDAPWRLLGATALLLHPEMTYVVARYRRKGVDELVLTSRSSLPRLTAWLAGAEIEVVDEGPGARWAGRPYEYPLRSEFPMGADLSPPAGTLQAVLDVGDSGTGLVPLVPGHGGTDAQIAERLGITGWPLVTPRGQLATTLLHKYAGLDLATASEFVLRDLGDGGALFARLRVRRGVPHCAICGTALVWAPGRAWCLEPAQLPREWAEAYRRLLPKEPPIAQIEIAAWPVSESTSRAAGVGAVTLLECPQCERLDPPGGSPTCPCGASRRPVSRRLLPAIQGILEGWARADPFPPGDSARIYLNERRRAPALVHHLAVISGVRGVPRDVELTLLPGAPDAALRPLLEQIGPDAVRGALVRCSDAAPSPSAVGERCTQEARFLEQYWHLAKGVFDRIDASLLTAFQPAVTGFLAELQAEDLAILARWEKARVATLAEFDAQHPGRAYRRLGRFLSNDLPRYRGLVAARLAPTAPAADRRAALRTLHHLLRSSAVLLAPVAPHTAEMVYGAATTGGTSLFEATVDAVDANLLDDRRARGWDRWQSVLTAVEQFRATQGISGSTRLPKVVALVASDELADALRAERPTIERLAALDSFEACGPATPWTGRRRDLEPVLSEIQKVYPSEATQIAHLLRRTPSRRRPEGSAAETLEVVLQGTPRRILPSMVTFTERLPDRVVPAWWRLGELYVELPSDRPTPGRAPPPLSPDLFRLVRTIEHERRRRAPNAGSPPGPVLVATVDPLAAEIRRVAPALAAYLEVPEVRVVTEIDEVSRGSAFRGRTRTGVRWWLYLPGLAPEPVRTKHRPARSTGSRVRAPHPPAPAEQAVDFGAPDFIAREEQVRALMQELDGLLGAPLLGFAKTSGAWEAGLHSRSDYESAPFETLAALPGFGWPLAETLVEKLGRPAPPRPRPVRRTFTPSTGSRPPVAATRRVLPTLGMGPDARSEQPASPVPVDAALSAPPSRSPPNLGPEVEPPVPTVVGPPPTGEPVPPASEAEIDLTLAVPETESPANPGTPVTPSPLVERSAEPPPAAPPFDPAPGPSPPLEERGEIAAPVTESGPGEPVPEPPSTAPSLDDLTPGSPGPLARPDLEVPPFGLDTEGAERAEGPVAEPPSEQPTPAPSPPESPALERDSSLPLHSAPVEGLPPLQVGTEVDEGPEHSPEPPLEQVDRGPPSVTAESTSPSDRSAASTPEPAVLSEEARPPEPEPLSYPEEPPSSPGETVDLAVEAPAGPVEPAEQPGPPPTPTVDRSGPDPSPSLATEPPEPAQPAPPGPAAGSEEVGPVPTIPPDSVTPAPESPLEGGTIPESVPPPTLGSPPPSEQLALESPVAASRSPPGLEEPPIVTGEPSPATVEPPRTPLPAASPESPVPSGGVELVVQTSYLPALSEFLEATAAGHRGLAVVRESPERLRTRIGHRPAEVYWLTNLGRGLTLKPSDLDGYRAFLEAAVERDRVTAVFLEGLEYLVRLHGVDRLLTVLLDLHARAQAHEARVWVCVHPDLIAPEDLERLVTAFPTG